MLGKIELLKKDRILEEFKIQLAGIGFKSYDLVLQVRFERSERSLLAKTGLCWQFN